MDRAHFSRRPVWSGRAVFVFLALVIMFFHLLPLNTTPRNWAPPDLLLTLCFAWTVRRPEYAPPTLIGATLLLADTLLQRPPGLLALFAMLACLYLSPSNRNIGKPTFPAEWLSVAFALMAVAFANRFALNVFDIPQPALAIDISRFALTILAYPAVAWLSEPLLNTGQWRKNRPKSKVLQR